MNNTTFNATTDAQIVRHILDINGFEKIAISDIAQSDKITRRIISFNFDGRSIGRGLDTISRDISGLTELKYFRIMNSSEFKRIPEEFWDLNKLMELEISGTALMSLSRKIERLKKLEYLYLTNNRLLTVPKEISTLNKLRVIDLHDNWLLFIPKKILEMNAEIRK